MAGMEARGIARLGAAVRDALLTDTPSAAFRRVLLLVLLPTLIWFPTLTFDFVLDDAGTFLEDPLARGPLDLSAIFGSPVHVERSRLPFYRPIITLTYWLDRTLWGVNPAGFHLTNLAWHVLTVLLAYLVFRRAGAGPGVGLAVAALFAVLPSHAEAVAWIQGRVDLVASAFFLLSASIAIRLQGQATLLGWMGALLAFALALLAKEPAIVLPGVLVLLWRFRGPERWRATAFRLAPFLVVVASYFGFRRAVLSGTTGFALELDQIFARGAGILAVLGEYLRILTWPGLPPNFHMAVAQTPSANPGGTIAGAAILIGMVAAIGIRGRGRSTDGPPVNPVGMGLAWFLITLAPALGVVGVRDAPTAGYLVTERYLYLPALGLCLVVAFGFTRLWARSAWGLGAMTLLLAVACGGALARAQAWQDAETMYRAILPRTGDRALAHGNLGTLYLARGEIPAAITEFEAILREDPTHPGALNNLGVTRARQGRKDEALALYREALRSKPAYAEAWNNLGVLMEERGARAEARTAYQRALAIDPTLTQARRNLEGLGQASLGVPGEDR
ncbi:MAG: tetratricopeptide repeat protein [candidate division NC10 bacterium]|nr:tetratricopeptide repeat protein [candidate division NC10 bacterium]